MAEDVIGNAIAVIFVRSPEDVVSERLDSARDLLERMGASGRTDLLLALAIVRQNCASSLDEPSAERARIAIGEIEDDGLRTEAEALLCWIVEQEGSGCQRSRRGMFG